MKRKFAIDGVWNDDHPDPRFHDMSDAKLDAWEKAGGTDRKLAEWIRYELVQQEVCPLKAFLPHGIPHHKKPAEYAGGRIVLPPSTYPAEWENDGVAFLNDWEHDYVMLKAPRKTGKSLAGAVKMGLLMLETQPDWPIYSQQGRWRVQYRPWQGPKIGLVASFSWSNVTELWEAYREAWPREELGPYAFDWGKYPGEDGRPKNLAFGDGKPKEIRPCKSGGRLIFLCYTQAQAIWENFKADAFHADEQVPLAKLNAFEDGSRTRGDYTPAFFTWSGFALPERPDTGLAGPMAQIWSGRLKRGSKTVARYNMDVPSTPDSIITPKKKKELFDLYANPEIERDKKTERRGLAVYYPGDEPGAGLCFGPDTWSRETHVINPLWEDSPPKHYTLYRVTDYCPNKTTAVLFIAVGPLKLPNGEKIIAAFLYRMIYEQDLLVAQCAKRMIELSHNEQVEIDGEVDDSTGEYLRRYVEKQSTEEFFKDLIDSRIGSQRQGGEEILDMFVRYGIVNMEPASGAQNVSQISGLMDWMRVDYDLPHPFLKNEDGSPKMGCPRFFVFDGRGDGFVDEVENMPNDEKGVGVIDKKFPHDAIDAGKYWSSCSPCYLGNEPNEPVESYDDDGGRMPETGY